MWLKEYVSSQYPIVKVYSLIRESGVWNDKGKGVATVTLLRQADTLGLIVVDENSFQPILLHRIEKEDIYQRQEGQEGHSFIIQWQDLHQRTDIALSFSDIEGCEYIWNQINDVYKNGSYQKQGNAHNSRLGNIDELEAQSQGPMPYTTIEDNLKFNFQIPHPEPSNLQDIATILAEVPQIKKEQAAQHLLKSFYLQEIFKIFKESEITGNRKQLINIFQIMKQFILLNDSQLLEELFHVDNILTVIGTLEYDPNNLSQTPHRAYLLQKQKKYKQIVPFEDPNLVQKIHQTYQIQYIKDVILPTTLDDLTFSTLHSLILLNNMEIVTAIQHDQTYAKVLFEKLLGMDPQTEEWQSLVGLLQELVSMLRTFDRAQRSSIYDKFRQLGLFQIMYLAIKAGQAQVQERALSTLLHCATHEPRMLIEYMLQDNKLLGLLVDKYISSDESSYPILIHDIFKSLLDPESLAVQPEKSPFLEQFYSFHMEQLIKILKGEALSKNDLRNKDKELDKKQIQQVQDTSYSKFLITDLLQFCIEKHSFRIKYFIMRHPVMESVIELFQRPQRWLHLAPIRLVRTQLALKEEFYIKLIIQRNTLLPMLNEFVENGLDNRNLLYSAILELFEYIKSENMNDIIKHLYNGENAQYSTLLDKVQHISTFQNLKYKYSQLVGHNQSEQDTELQSRTYTSNPKLIKRKRKDERDLDKDEDDYFSELEDPTDSRSNHSIQTPRSSAQGIYNGQGRQRGPMQARVVYQSPTNKSEGSAQSKERLQIGSQQNATSNQQEVRRQQQQQAKRQQWDNVKAQGPNQVGGKESTQDNAYLNLHREQRQSSQQRQISLQQTDQNQQVQIRNNRMDIVNKVLQNDNSTQIANEVEQQEVGQPIKLVEYDSDDDQTQDSFPLFQQKDEKVGQRFGPQKKIKTLEIKLKNQLGSQ